MKIRRVNFVASTVVVTLALWSGAGALATDCADYADIMRVCGTTDVGFTTADVAVDGSVAYIVGSTQLASWDLSDPDAPQQLDAVALPVAVTKVAAAGGLVCAMGATQIVVVDATDPANLGAPVLVTPPQAPSAVDVGSGLLLVAAGSQGLLVYSLADPAAPVMVGQHAGAYAADVSARGDRALIVGSSHLTVIDLADPTHPAPVGVFGASNPDGSAPTYEQVEATAAGAVVYSRGEAFIANFLIGVDLADPTAPTSYGWAQIEVGGCELDDAGADRVFLQQYGSILIYTAEPDLGLRLNANVPWSGPSGGVGYGGGAICAVKNSTQMLTIDASAGAGFVAQRAALPKGDVADGWLLTSAVTWSGMYWSLAYKLIDVRDPFQPAVRREGGFGGGPGGSGSVQLRGTWGDQVAYWSTDGVGHGIALADFSVTPPAIGSLAYVENVTRAGDRLFAYGNGIVIYDVSDFAHPVRQGEVYSSSTVVAAPSPGAFYAAGANALLVYECIDPVNPVQVATVPLPDGVGFGAIAGDRLFVKSGAHGYVVLDISDPYAPVVTGGGTVVGTLGSFTVHDDLVVARMSSPTAFQVLSATGPLGQATALPAEAKALVWQDDHLYVALGSYPGEFGLEVYDLTDPATPVFVGRGAPTDDIAPGPGVLVCSGLVMPLQCAEDLVAVEPGDLPPVSRGALQAAPNPFNPRTTLRFTLERADVVDLVIYDLAGRRVRTLWHGDLAAGEAALAWDGRDDSGRSQPSGVYVARVRATGLEATARLALLR